MYQEIMNDGEEMLKLIEQQAQTEISEQVYNRIVDTARHKGPKQKRLLLISTVRQLSDDLLKPYMSNSICEPYIILRRSDVEQEMQSYGLMKDWYKLSNKARFARYKEYVQDDITDRYGNVLATCPKHGNIEFYRHTVPQSGFFLQDNTLGHAYVPLSQIQFPISRKLFGFTLNLVKQAIHKSDAYLDGLPASYQRQPLDDFAYRCITSGWLLPAFDAIVDYNGIWLDVEHCQRGEVVSKYIKGNFDFYNSPDDVAPEDDLKATLFDYWSDWMDVLITRMGNTLCLSTPEGNGLGSELRASLNHKFMYTLRTMGPMRKFTFEDIQLLIADESNRLIGMYGLCDDIVSFLRSKKIRCLMCDKTPQDKNTLLIKPDWSKVENFSFRPRQRECLEAFVAKRHGIIQAPVGFGKTTLLQVLIQIYPFARFHFCTRSVAIANRIYHDMIRVTPNVGMVTGGKEELSKRITVITADSLMKSDGNADFFIFDECHQAAAPTYAKAITALYRYARCYGFSATPTGRSDGADAAVTQLFGKIIFQMEYDEAKDRGLVVPVKVRWLTNSEGRVHPQASKAAQFRMGLWANDARNSLIASDVRANTSAMDQVLILVATVEHAVRLGAYLPDFTLVYGSMTPEDLAMYKKKQLLPEDYKPLNLKQREALKQQFYTGELTRVISTDVWNTGVDFPALSLVYNVSGRASKILTTQGAGRVSRIFTDKAQGTVVDVVDTFQGCTTNFYRNAMARYKTYKSLGWQQEGWKRNG